MKFLRDIPLAGFTTFRIGGRADFLVEVDDKESLQEAVLFAREKHWPVTLLGWGSNVLVSDQGVRGAVIVNKTKEAKWEREEGGRRRKRMKIRVEAGTGLPGLIEELLAQGTTGLEKFVGIPGTIGGAIFNNIHGQDGYLFQEVVEAVKVLDREGKTRLIPRDECRFGYDFSRFQKTGEVILEAVLSLPQTDFNEAKRTAEEWGRKKAASQPGNSAGCVFKNLTSKQQKELGLPTPSFGYVIDKILGLKGRQIGGAKISEKHANFIVNATGRAKAADVLALIKLIKRKTQQKLGLEPKLEIFLLGEF